MKKILVLVLVSALTQVAGAGVIELTKDGQSAPQEITLNPSDWIELDIDLISGSQSGYDIGITIDGPGSLDITDINFPTTYTFAGKVVDDPAYDLRVSASVFLEPAPQAPKVLVNEIMFHCDGLGEVTITLIAIKSTDGYDPLATIDTLTIWQIPEPTTVALLGLGGLLLRRRRT